MHYAFKQRVPRIVLLWLALLLSGCGSSPGDTASCPDAAGPIADAIVLETENSLATIREQGGAAAPLFTLPQHILARSPAWSPDGQTLAFTLMSLKREGQGFVPQNYRICGLDRQTGKGRVLIAGRQTIMLLDEAAWMPDGKALLVVRHEVRRPSEIMRYDLTTGAEQAVIASTTALLRAPAVAPDGQSIAYIEIDRLAATPGPALVVVQADGQNRRPVSRAEQPSDFMAGPRWAPDGRQILFTATQALPISARSSASSLLDSLMGFGASVASAHEINAALWLVDADGQNLRQVIPDLNDPRAAWSPDGQRIAYTGGIGVAIFDLGRGQSQPISPQNGHGISWAWH